MRTDDVLAADILSDKLASTPGSYFYLKDGLGSVTDIADASGNLVQHYRYSSFGELLKIVDSSGNDITSNAPIKTSYGYTNREHDEESGLMYYRARYYIPALGRFLTSDPHPGKLSIPITVVNKYAYVGNNPVINVDPDGEFFFTAMAIGAIIGGVIAESNGGSFMEGALIGAAAGGVGAFVGGAVGLGVGNAVSGFVGGTAGSILGGVSGLAAGAYFGGQFGGLAGGLVGGLISVSKGDAAEDGFYYGLGLGFSVGAITGGAAGLGSFAYGDFLVNGADFGIGTSLQQGIYNAAYSTTAGFMEILRGPQGKEYLPLI